MSEVVSKAAEACQAMAFRLALFGRRGFTAADISVTYALNFGQWNCGIPRADAEHAYLARITGRDAYKRATERSREGVNT